MVSDLKLIDWSSFAESMPQKGWWCRRDAKCHMMSHCCNMMSQWFRSLGSHLCMLALCMHMYAYACSCVLMWGLYMPGCVRYTYSCNVLALECFAPRCMWHHVTFQNHTWSYRAACTCLFCSRFHREGFTIQEHLLLRWIRGDAWWWLTKLYRVFLQCVA